MMKNQSVGGEEARAKKEKEMKKEKATEKTEPLPKPRSGSVFPAGRKLVKRMVCECIIEGICAMCSKVVPPTASDCGKGTSVHPSSSQLVHDTDMAD